MRIRKATLDDIDRMVELSDIERTDLAKYSPVFWRKAQDSSEKQVPFFRAQFDRENNIILIAENAGVVDGFLIASVVNAPLVYDPGGQVCVVDDYGLVSEDLWPTVGKALLDEALVQAKARGAVLSVVICPNLDQPKRTMLQERGMTIASEWYIGEIK